MLMQKGQQWQEPRAQAEAEEHRINFVQRAAIHAKQLDTALKVSHVQALQVSIRNKPLGGAAVCADAVLQQQRYLALRVACCR